MIWGYAGVWYGPLFGPEGPPPEHSTERLYAQLALLRRYGLKCLGIGLGSFARMPEAERDRLAAYLEEHDLHLTAYVGFRYLEASEEEAQRAAEETAALLEQHARAMRCPLCITTPNAGHRFDRTLPLEEKLDRLTRSLSPLAEAVHSAGLRLGIENHGDYYVSDLVDLCDRVPRLGLFLDTGNTYLIGERPLPAFELGAPYVVGTHFKDHRVRPCPDARPLHFEVGGSALGEGDVPLRECWELLLRHAPDPEGLVMEIEMVAPDDLDPVESMRRSVEFVRSLPTELTE